MSFIEIAKARESCRSYDPCRPVGRDVLLKLVEAARLAPSACNAQPYHLTVCTGSVAARVAETTQGMGMNKFASSATAFIVVSEDDYNATAAMGAKVKRNDYRSIDIGIVTAYITAEAETLGLGSCILGWFDAKRLTELCSLRGTPRLVIALGYKPAGYENREKKRKSAEKLASFIEE